MVKIAVVGDSMVDEDFIIEANRISPEFPIPVMLSSSSLPKYQFPGGAANVAFQLSHMDVDFTLGCLLDSDARNIFNRNNITKKNICCICDESYMLPRKKRFYNGDFPLCRWDVENKFSDHHAVKKLLEIFERQIDPQIMILSDYDKGFFNSKAAKQLWLNKKWTTIVDPKKGNLHEWEGCDIFKPNFKEATELTGTDEWMLQLKIIKDTTKCKLAIVTNGGVLYGYDNEFWQIGPESKNAQYPIGAGDCFVAALAVAVSKGKSFFDAAWEAHQFGRAYVNTPKRYVNLNTDILGNKIMSTSEIAKEVATNSHMKFVFTNGCFDILHDQHIELLKYAKSKGDFLIVALNSDNSIKRLKGENRPIQTLDQRLKIMNSIQYVDYVTWFEEDTPLETIKEINPWAIIKGGDYCKENVVGYNEVKQNVFIFPYKKDISSTELIKKATLNY